MRAPATCLIAASVFLSLASAAVAAGSEADYVAARDRYIAYFKKLDAANKLDDDRMQRDLDDLEGKLRQIIGPVAINGLAADGKINLDTLSRGDEDFGRLDGLVYSAPGGDDAADKTRVLVTTSTLLDRWLREHKSWWERDIANVPQTVAAALKTEAFYTQAIGNGAAIVKYAELPVAAPAAALLIARSQVDDPSPPDEILVSLVRGGRFYLVSTPAKASIATPAMCQKAWDESQRKSAAVKNEDRREKLEQAGVAAFHSCFAKLAKDDAQFAPLTDQARAMIERLAVVPATAGTQ
jgi:hypothetical protein